MKKLSDEQRREELRQRIIGLGEKSLKKSYYPELQKRIRELEIINTELEREIKHREETEKLKEKLETQLRHAQKMEAIGVLAGGIAHDFNNILSAVVGYTELAKIQLQNCDKRVEKEVANDLNGVLRSAKRAKELVAQILSFSAQRSGEHTPVNLQHIVAETAKMLRALIPTTIAIEQVFKVKDSMILADATQINQILMNLGTNAYHAMREKGGTLRLEVTERVINKKDVFHSNMKVLPGKYVILRVSDTGCGMTRPIMDRIFDPYFSTKNEEGGTGLGLSVVHGIVSQHNGHISVYSEPSQGTSFILYFPKLREEVSTGSREHTATALHGGSEHLLVVDDEIDILKIMKGLLTSLGYRVTTTNSSSKALNLFSKAPDTYDLLITDMNMPKMSGAELISQVRKIRPDLPIVLCTGFSEFMNANNTQELGSARYMMKPVTQHQLNASIRSLLD